MAWVGSRREATEVHGLMAAAVYTAHMWERKKERLHQ